MSNHKEVGVAQTRLRGEPVLADPPAEQITPTDTTKIDDVRHWLDVARRVSARGPPLEGAVRPVLVVMQDVGREDVLELAAAEDQQPVEALAAQCPDPAFGVRPRLRRPYRRLDHPDTLGAEHLVEVAGELAVAVADEKPRTDALVIEVHGQVARPLGHPAAVRVRRNPGDVDAARRELEEEQDVEALQEEGVDGEEVALEDGRRLRSQELRPARVVSPR